MTKAEHETHINYDYKHGTVIIYTTRRGEKNGILRRLPEDIPAVEARVNDGREVAWTIRIPEKYARNAQKNTVVPDKGQRLASAFEGTTDKAA